MTTEFQQDTEMTPVLFRVSRAPVKNGDEVTAVFPCEPADLDKYTMSCYARVGQHSGCNYGWYLTTRPAKPEEYADLKQELESAPYGYRLKVYQRITSDMRNKLMHEISRLRNYGG